LDKLKYPDLWNRFSDEVYDSFLNVIHGDEIPFPNNKNKSISDFTAEQKNAIIAFAYDAEINNGGHLTFFDCFGSVFSVDEVAEALRITGGDKCSSNFLSAAAHIHYVEELEGYMPDNPDDPEAEKEDFVYYEMNPALPDLLEQYIFDNKAKIFL
jgi:hypothetical protein